MSISKGAFGQSAKGSFIESPMGARGWNAGGVAVLSGSGTTDRYLAALNAKTGAKLWENSIISVSGSSPFQLMFNSAFQLFNRRGGTTGIERRSMTDGSVELSYAVNSAFLPGAIGTGLSFSYADATLGPAQRRSTKDFTALWTYDSPNANQVAACHTDSAGVSYFVRQDLLVNAAMGIHRWALSSAGSLLWAQFQEPVAFDAFTHQILGFVDTDETYIYAMMEDGSGGTSTVCCYRFLKADGSRIDNRTTAFDTGEGSASTGVANLRVANNSVYIPIRVGTYTTSVVRMAKDMTEMSRIGLGTSATSVDVLPNDSIGSGDILVTGNTSTTWPGASGARANTWRISSDLTTIRWGVQVGTAAFNGLHAISSYKPRFT